MPSESFPFSGSYYEFTVPDGVTELLWEAWAGEGGLASSGTGTPGKGGHHTTPIAVTPGEDLRVYVGGKGEDYQSFAQGGYPNGGDHLSPLEVGGAGGGGTSIRRAPYGVEDTIAAVGGGGGAAIDRDGGDGGLTGEDGEGTPTSWNGPPEASSGLDMAQGGKGATETAAGLGGWSGTDDVVGNPATEVQEGDGDSDAGGPGRAFAGYVPGGGGAGGGGYWGGGAGGAGFNVPGGGGGGGAGKATGHPDEVFETGVRSGDGEAILSWSGSASIDGAFTEDTVHVGDEWNFAGTADSTVDEDQVDDDGPLLLSLRWDGQLGANIHLHIQDDAAAESDVDLTGTLDGDTYTATHDVGAAVFPLGYLITGTAASPAIAAEMTAALVLDGTSDTLDETSDTIIIGESIETDGDGIQLELVDEEGDRVWTKVDDWVAASSVSFERGCGVQGPYLRQSVGRCRFTLDNFEGLWDPLNLANGWVNAAGETLLQPGLRCRVSVRHPDWETGRIVWTGRVSNWPTNYAADLWSDVPVDCVDATERLGAAARPAHQSPVGAGDGVRARIIRVLQRMGYLLYDLPTESDGHVHLQGTTMSRGANEELQLTADSDGGWVYLDRYGRVCYRPRDWFIDAEPSLVLSMFPDDLDDGALLLAPPVEPTLDQSRRYNQMKLSRAGGTEQTATADDADPLLDLGYRTFSRSDLITSNNVEVMDLALHMVGQFRASGFRWSKASVELHEPVDGIDMANSTTEAWEAVVDREFGDLVTVKHATVDGRTIAQDHIIAGFRWTPDVAKAADDPEDDTTSKRWTVTLDLVEIPPVWPDAVFGEDEEE